MNWNQNINSRVHFDENKLKCRKESCKIKFLKNLIKIINMRDENKYE
jgi:hypothetical protein